MTVSPDEIFEAAIVHDVLTKKNRQMYKTLGPYVPSG